MFPALGQLGSYLSRIPLEDRVYIEKQLVASALTFQNNNYWIYPSLSLETTEYLLRLEAMLYYEKCRAGAYSTL